MATGVFRTAFKLGEIAESCLNPHHWKENIALLKENSLRVLYSFIASRKLANDQKFLSETYSKPSIEAWLAILYNSINTKIDNGQLSLDYESLHDATRANANWHPLIQGLYDNHDSTLGNEPSEGEEERGEVPIEMVVLALFQLIWFGTIKFYKKSEYLTTDEVSKYINDHVSCGDPTTYVFNNRHFHVPENILVTPEYNPRVYFFALDYTELNQDYKYNPSNVYDERLNRLYTRVLKMPPPLVKISGSIVEKKYNTQQQPRETSTLQQYNAKMVTVQLDDGQKFDYDISQLYLSEIQPMFEKKRSIFEQPEVDTQKRQKSGGSKKRKQNKKSQKKRNVKGNTQKKHKK